MCKKLKLYQGCSTLDNEVAHKQCSSPNSKDATVMNYIFCVGKSIGDWGCSLRVCTPPSPRAGRVRGTTGARWRGWAATRLHTPAARHQPRALRPYCPVTAVCSLSTAASGQAGRGVAIHHHHHQIQNQKNKIELYFGVLKCVYPQVYHLEVLSFERAAEDMPQCCDSVSVNRLKVFKKNWVINSAAIRRVHVSSGGRRMRAPSLAASDSHAIFSVMIANKILGV